MFLTWEWVETWWQTYQSDFTLLVLVANDGGRPCGIAPLVIRKGSSPRLEFFGQNRAYGEYLDFIVRRGMENRVTPLICQELKRLGDGGTWRRMCLALVRADSPNFSHICRSFLDLGLEIRRSPPRISPTVDLPANWADYLELKGRKLRDRVAYNERRLAREGGFLFEYPIDDTQVDAFFDDLVSLHNERWQKPMDDVFFGFHRTIARRFFPLGRLLLTRLRLGQKVVAAKYDFVFDNRAWGYQGGWLPDCARLEVGTVLLCEIFKHCIDRRIRIYDFLEGNEWYKRRWSTNSLTCYDLNYGEAGPPFVF